MVDGFREPCKSEVEDAYAKAAEGLCESENLPASPSEEVRAPHSGGAGAPERMVWGSDWPHPTERDRKPDDAQLFDLVAEWAPDERLRQRLLVDNPAELYGFPR